MLFLLNSVLKQVCKDSKQQRSICRMHTFQLRHQWSALCNVDLSGVDPASNVRGVALSVKFGSQVSLQAYHCKRDEVYSTKLLWQNNGGQNGFMSWMLFSESHKIMMNKITFVGFREGDRLNCPPPGSVPAQVTVDNRLVCHTKPICDWVRNSVLIFQRWSNHFDLLQEW